MEGVLTKEKTASFSPETMAEIQRLLPRFPDGRQKSALLRILHLVQEENDGWLSTEVMDRVAGILNIQPIEVYEVATFYTMYNLKPIGKYLLELCHTGPCAIEGAERLLEYLKQKLEIGVGETTPDGLFTLKTVECMGACGYAPMMQVGEFYHEHLTEAKIDRFLQDCRDGKVALGTWKLG